MDGPIKVATIAAVFWGIAGFVVGDVIAWQLAFPALNLDLPLLLVLRVVMLPMRRAFLCGHLKR